MAIDPTQVKSIFASKTFWGAVITALAMAFPITFTKLGISSENSAVIAQHITQGLGTLLAIYGRFTATQAVSLLGK